VRSKIRAARGGASRGADAWRDHHRVAVVVVNYRTPALTVACVESVIRSTGVRPRVIVVDNASGDDSADQLRALAAGHDAVTLDARATNDGYAGGNDAGVAIARRMRARLALLLNADAVLAPDCLRLLVEALERDERVAASCPRIFLGDRPDRLWFGGARLSPWSGRPAHVGYGRGVEAAWDAPRDLPFATGCALLLRLSALDGDPFDRSLFSYAEDVDLSLRLRRAGHRIRYVPAATVWHHEGSSHRRAGGGGESLRAYLYVRNVLRVAARHARWYHWPTLAPMLAVNVVGRMWAVAARDGDRDAMASALRGAWHALVGGRHPIERALDGSTDR
jgi:GT2 family glycosyltransferase